MTANAAFQGKRVLITGASGFIGNALASSLSRVECEIVRSSRNAEKLLPLPGSAKIVDREVDYADTGIWPRLTDGVDIVFFLGAQTSANDANEEPDRDFRENVLPLLNLLQHCRESGRRPAIVFASTATVVGMTENLPVTEGIFENPVTVYDIHKLCCEKYLSYYAGNGFVKSCSLRLANVYGPGTSASSADRGILNMMIRRAIQKESLSIYGEGLQVRDYTYISDVVDALQAAAANIEQTNGRYFNIGNGRGYNFIEAFDTIADCVTSMLGHDVCIEHVAAPDDLALIERRNYVADSRRFTEATGWTAQIKLREGIRQTIERLAD